MVNDSVAPAFWGAGSKETCMTESQSVQRLLSVEYLMSYRAAVPEVLSSPGAVQLSVTELCVKLATLRSVILDGDVPSSSSVPVDFFEQEKAVNRKRKNRHITKLN